MHARRRRPWRLAAVLLPAVLLACSPASPPPALIPAPSPEEVEASLFLIGDAGNPSADDHVLAALTAAVAGAPNATIVFLGDNVYTHGLPDTSAPDRREHEDRLRRQMRVGLAGRVPTYFIPGNHDWQKGGDSGWAAIRRQEAFITAEGDGLTKMVPGGGCPGPVVVEIPGRLRLVALDSQWFLHGGPKPTAECRPGTAPGVVDSLASALDVPGSEDAVVVLHHPLETHGPHGGHFTVSDHLFPLHNVAKWLYLPLPIIGSLYPLSRQAGISDQDLSGSRYELMRAQLRRALAQHVPRIVASGHDHTLQVISDSTVPTQLVSGAGYDGHTESVAWRANTRFAASIAGFMRVDRLKDGRLRLGVLRPTETGAEELHSEWLPTVHH